MPLLKRKAFERSKSPDFLRNDEEVFFCEQTKEIFKNYEEYFERVMLTSSMVWTCSYTGKPNLTYSEALDSERDAKRILRAFPKGIRGPSILVASQTRRSAISQMMDDVFNFVKDRYFTGERVDVLHGNKYRCCKIVDVLKPSNASASASPVKPERLRYKVEAVDEKPPKEWVAQPDNVKRDKSIFTKEKMKLFLKQHIDYVNNMIKIKDESYKKYVTDQNITVEDVFIGKPPDFELSKRLVELQEKEAKRKLDIQNGVVKPKKSSSKSSSSKADKKQPSIQKYLNKADPNPPSKPKMSAKEREEASKKLKEEMERRKKEQEEREAERKKRLEEEKAELNAQVNSAVKEYNQFRDDLECIDQRPMPVPKKVSTLIGDKYFGDFVQILEFMHTFAELLSIKDKFPHGLAMPELERALLLKEVNGPLTDILQVLLSTLFSLQIEEANEVTTHYDPNYELSQRRNDVENLRDAARVGLWCQKHYSTHLNELVMDSTTLSELLRLHFLASGALITGQGSNWRYQQRGGYLSHDDPGYAFCQENPHILRTLGKYTVYQLPLKDIIQIIKCLMDQLLTYSSVRDTVEDRLEKAAKARFNYKNLCAAERKREATLQSDKNKLKEEMKKALAEFTGTKEEQEALKKEKEAEIQAKCETWDAHSDREKTKFLRECQKLKEEFFDYQLFLGSDRAGRNYFLFESMPGLFVEHDTTFSGVCQDALTTNLPGLANCPADQRNKFIKQMVIDRKAISDKENKAENGMIQPTINGVLKDDKLDSTTPILMKGPNAAELMMCTTDPNNCPVHSVNYPQRIHWGVFNTEEELNALINSLNTRGLKEKTLKENLELERDLILNHIKWCQVDKVMVNDEERDQKIKEMIEHSARKYQKPNFNFEPDTDVNMIMDTKLRDDLLDFEYKLKAGYLGDIKVTNRHVWRAAIESFAYDSQCDSLKWGPDQKLYEGKINGHVNDEIENADVNDDDEGNEEADGQEQTLEIDEEEARFGNVKRDPGYGLEEKMSAESDDSQEDITFLHNSETLKYKVHSLASALLQIEQGIEGKFIRQPFGPKRDFKDKDVMARKNMERRKRLERWEESLMRSSSYSQVFLHLNILFDSIMWSRSAAKMNCVTCRSSKSPEYTLLCDECNKGYHTFCLKPKVKVIPEGNWYCPKCKPEDFVIKRGRKRRAFTEEEPEEIQEEEEEGDTQEEEDTSMMNENDSIEEEEFEKPRSKGRKSNSERKKRKPKIADIFRSRRTANNLDSRRSSITDDSERPSRRSKRSLQKDESDNESLDDMPLISIKKRPSRNSRKRNHDEDDIDDEDEDDGPSLRKRGRKSRKSNEDEASSSRRSGRTRNVDSDDENLILHTTALYTVLDDISKHPSSWPFNRPVSLKEVPDYHDIIKNPMDFAKIKSRLNMGHYKTDYDIMNDIQLVFANCDLYNNSGSEIYNAGIELEKYVQEKCKEHKLPFRSSDMLGSGHHNNVKNKKKRTI